MQLQCPWTDAVSSWELPSLCLVDSKDSPCMLTGWTGPLPGAHTHTHHSQGQPATEDGSDSRTWEGTCKDWPLLLLTPHPEWKKMAFTLQLKQSLKKKNKKMFRKEVAHAFKIPLRHMWWSGASHLGRRRQGGRRWEGWRQGADALCVEGARRTDSALFWNSLRVYHSVYSWPYSMGYFGSLRMMSVCTRYFSTSIFFSSFAQLWEDTTLLMEVGEVTVRE